MTTVKQLYKYTGCFIMSSVITNIYNKKTIGPTLTFRNRASYILHILYPVITNIYNKKTIGPTLMEFFTATGKLKEFF